MDGKSITGKSDRDDKRPCAVEKKIARTCPKNVRKVHQNLALYFLTIPR